MLHITKAPSSDGYFHGEDTEHKEILQTHKSVGNECNKKVQIQTWRLISPQQLNE